MKFLSHDYLSYPSIINFMLSSKNVLYGVQSPIESHESPKTEFVSHEIFKSRVTYLNFDTIKVFVKI
jgi:hypothetical protein